MDTTEAPVFRLRGGASWREPWADYARLREGAPVAHVVPPESPEHDFYVLSRHADVLAAAVDTTTYSSRGGLTVRYDEVERAGLAGSLPLVMQDPPDHGAFRRRVSRGFTPRRVGDLEPLVRDFVRERLPALRDGGDVVAAVFKPLPSMVVAHYLGVPSRDRTAFDTWTDAIVAAGSAGDVLDAADAVGDMLGYVEQLVDHRRRHRGDDTVSDLVAAGQADDPAGLAALLGYVFTMITGGNDTTTGLLGGGVALLAAHPEQRARVLAGEVALADAVEELLRLTTPVQGLARTVTRDVTVHDVTVPAGRKVLLLYGAGNRDPRRFGPDADELDVARRPAQLLSFGQGAHHCLGASAARLQARVALEELLTAYPRFEVDLDAVTWAEGPYVRRPTRVPFVGRG